MFLFQVREQEFDVNFWIKSLNSLTWIEILRQVLVASGFGSDHHMLNRNFFNKVLNGTPHYSRSFNTCMSMHAFQVTATSICIYAAAIDFPHK